MCYVCNVDGKVIHIPRSKGAVCNCDLTAKKGRYWRRDSAGEAEKKAPKRASYVLTRSGDLERDGVLTGSVGLDGQSSGDEGCEDLCDWRHEARQTLDAALTSAHAALLTLCFEVDLPPRQGEIAVFLLRTKSRFPSAAAATRFKLTPGRVSQHMKAINRRLRAFTGDPSEDILQWRASFLERLREAEAYAEMLGIIDG